MRPNLKREAAKNYVGSFVNNKFVEYSKKGKFDFSSESFLYLLMHFLSIYKLVLSSTNKILNTDNYSYIALKYQNQCFNHNADLIYFFENYDRLSKAVTNYLSSKCNFSKDIYLASIRSELIQLIPIFNALSEYLGSFSNTCVYRNVTVQGRVLSIIDRKMNQDHKYLIEYTHREMATFFNIYYSIFSKFYNVDTNVFGFVKGKSCIDNAKYHLANKPESIINTDVNKFFNNCTILKMLQSKVFLITLNNFKVPQEFINSFHVGIISLLFYATHNSVFPTGSIFTPVLSNLIFLNIDIEIQSYINSIVKQYDGADLSIRYSRYADDITVSSNAQKINNFNVLNIVVLKDIEKILNKYGFYIKYAKSKIGGKGDAKIVNGIVLDVEHNKLSVGADKKLHLKRVKDNTPDIVKDPSYIGYMSYLKSVSPEQYNYIMEIKNNDLRGTQTDYPW